MSNSADKLAKIILIITDYLLILASLWLTLLIRYQGHFSLTVWQEHWQVFSFLYLLWLPIFYSFNLYDLKKNLYLIDLLSNLVKATLVNLIISIIYFYLVSQITPKTILLINILIATVVIFLWRRLFITFSKRPTLEKNVLIVGWDPLVQELIKDDLPLGYKVKGIINQNKLDQIIDLPVYQDYDQLPEIIKNEKIQIIIIADKNDQGIDNKLFNLIKLRVNFISLVNFYEQIFQKIPLTMVNQSWFIENLNEGNKRIFEFLKRVFDIILSVLFGLISLPFIPLIVLLIISDSRGSVLFRQIRTGHDGRNFKAIKFRTMYQDSEKHGPTWATKNDPRVTKVGKFLRKSRVDEIPQLWNIVKGEMSFVGPRPERPEFIEELSQKIPFYQERLLVKPGLTGWAQINFSYTSSIDETLKKLQYDLYYVKNRSLILDLGIILKTLNTIFKGGGI